MATQLTLISIPDQVVPKESLDPTDPSATSTGLDAAEAHQSDDRTSSGAPQRTASRPTVSPPTGDRVPHRATGHIGWLDRRTISTGRKGVAAARAALADATRRVAERESTAELDRKRDLALMAGGSTLPATAAAPLEQGRPQAGGGAGRHAA